MQEERSDDVSQITNYVDLWPISAKLIELHATGEFVKGITQEMVEDIRMKYAVDIYEEFVEPLSS
ncbi:unnamed protein product [Arabis nemorensis]|uniref:Uncharacterized protein n=1 Tax=Arabis nemorensis TaxID=586526 RepID=A0A565BNU6_9BRAS|nr:unnamed protein product [Arabis nemorensis]